MTKNRSVWTKGQIKELVIETIEKQKPETAKHLVSLLLQTTVLPEKEITKLLIELKDENKIHFPKKGPCLPETVNEYVFSSDALWYWVCITLAAVTSVSVFAIPEGAVPLVYLRSVLGSIFVLFLPGFALIKTLFPNKVPVKTSSESMDTIECLFFGFGMSLVLIPITGLILSYTPWGISLTPLTLGLLGLTLVLATTAVLREYQAKSNRPK